VTRSTHLVTLTNEAYRLEVQLSGRDVLVNLRDLAMDADLCDGPCIYRASRTQAEGTLTSSWLVEATVQVEGQSVRVRGRLAGVTVEHRFTLPSEKAFLSRNASRCTTRATTWSPCRTWRASSGPDQRQPGSHRAGA